MWFIGPKKILDLPLKFMPMNPPGLSLSILKQILLFYVFYIGSSELHNVLASITIFKKKILSLEPLTKTSQMMSFSLAISLLA